MEGLDLLSKIILGTDPWTADQLRRARNSVGAARRFVDDWATTGSTDAAHKAQNATAKAVDDVAAIPSARRSAELFAAQLEAALQAGSVPSADRNEIANRVREQASGAISSLAEKIQNGSPEDRF